jgi:site-specific recombinase XerD
MQKKECLLVPLFEKFIKDMQSGRRLQANGKKLRASTIKNYKVGLQYLQQFELKNNQPIIIPVFKSNNKREWSSCKKYWQNFYLQFTDFLYNKGSFDNFVGSQVKMLKTFFKYIELEYGIQTGGFYQKFYVLKEEVDIHVLMPSQLKLLIYDQAFEATLRPRLQMVKDLFVVGCTVALRYNDLVQISWSDIIQKGDSYYLNCKAQKTDTFTCIRLPNYVMDILRKYKKRSTKKVIFPSICLDNFDTLIKVLFEMAGWTEPVVKKRSVRGVTKVLKPASGKPLYRFCDMASSHMMRRTAITTMIMHGVSETVVKQISGHAKGSKSFYRYVAYIQPFMDHELDKHFERMQYAS